MNNAPRNWACGLMAPAVLITLGALFLMDKLDMGLEFGDSWPVLLIVIGLVKVLQALAASPRQPATSGGPQPGPPQSPWPGSGSTPQP